MDDPRVIAAVIAGFVSLVASITGVLITLFTTRQRLKVQTEEIELKKRKIEHVQENLAAELEGLRQSQFEQVLTKRIEIYPKLWAIHIKFETNWVIEGRPKNRAWACNYLAALNEFNLEGGLFFSQDLYSMFHRLRSQLIKAIETTKEDQEVNEKLTKEIREFVYGKAGEYLGLSYYEKDDLGSYRAVTIQRRYSDST